MGYIRNETGFGLPFERAKPVEMSYYPKWDVKTEEELKEYYKDRVHRSEDTRDAVFFLVGYVSLVGKPVDVDFITDKVHSEVLFYKHRGYTTEEISTRCGISSYSMHRFLDDPNYLSSKLIAVVYMRLFPDDEDDMWYTEVEEE